MTKRSNTFLERVDRLRDSVLRGPGRAAPELRQAVARRSARHGAAEGATSDGVPPELEAFVDTVARCAYRITDAHVAGLLAAGYSEDEVFEITLAAALGAGDVRLERGLAALGRDREP